MKRRKGEWKIDFLCRAHDAKGKRLFGKRWGNANFGWSQTDTSIASKVYGKNPVILCTNLTSDGNSVTHCTKGYY